MIFLASFIEALKHVVQCPGTMLLASVSCMEATLYRLATSLVPKLKSLLLMYLTLCICTCSKVVRSWMDQLQRKDESWDSIEKGIKPTPPLSFGLTLDLLERIPLKSFKSRSWCSVEKESVDQFVDLLHLFFNAGFAQSSLWSFQNCFTYHTYHISHIKLDVVLQGKQ